MKNILIIFFLFQSFGNANAAYISYNFGCRSTLSPPTTNLPHYSFSLIGASPNSIDWYVDNVLIITTTASSGGNIFYYNFNLSGTHTVRAHYLVGISYQNTIISDNFVSNTMLFGNDLSAQQLNVPATNEYVFLYTGNNNFTSLAGLFVANLVIDNSTIIPVNLNQIAGNGSVLGTYQFSTIGAHTARFEVFVVSPSGNISCGNNTIEIQVPFITIVVPLPSPCCSTFAPLIGSDEPYWLSAWVKEDQPTQVKSYQSSRVELEFLGSGLANQQFLPTGEIIEGWQRIVGKFIVPVNTTDLKIHLVNNNSSIPVYFDDIRIHPFNASMKSYVYDPETLWLTSELDDNNYATFYEYDNEGQLIRIKKETARGVMTIQESRSSNPKQ